MGNETIVQNHEEKKLLLDWEAPSRPFKNRDKDFYTTVSMLAILSSVILFFLSEFLVILVIFSFVFVIFVLSSVPPENIRHELYNTGIRTGEHFYAWSDLEFFRFDARWGYDILYARTVARYPGALYLLLGKMSKEKIEEVIGNSLVKRDDVDNSWMDKASEWLTKKVPLERNA